MSARQRLATGAVGVLSDVIQGIADCERMLRYYRCASVAIGH